MSDIDLIPLAYRRRRWQSRYLRNSAVILGCILAAMALGLLQLLATTSDMRTRVEALEERQAISAQQRADLERLGVEKIELENQLRLLLGLRSSVAAEQMFVVIDRALTGDDVWFLEWQFQRAGVMVGNELRTVNTGYFIVIPDGAERSAPGNLPVQTNMTIKGQARDHSALSKFVRGLFAQPEIDDVRIRRTVQATRNRVTTVDFDLAIVLNTAARGE